MQTKPSSLPIAANATQSLKPADKAVIFPERPEEFLRELLDTEALLLHDDNPARPHLGLQKGHVGHLMDLRYVKQRAFQFDRWAKALCDKLRCECNFTQVTRVLGHGIHASQISNALAYHIASSMFRECLSSFTEHGTGNLRDQTLMRGIPIAKDEGVLITKDILVESRTVIASMEYVDQAGGTIIPFLPVLVNGTPHTHIQGLRIVSLLDYIIPVYPEGESCPYCAMGSRTMSATELRAHHWYTKPML